MNSSEIRSGLGILESIGKDLGNDFCPETRCKLEGRGPGNFQGKEQGQNRWDYYKKRFSAFDLGRITVLVLSIALLVFVPSDKLGASLLQTRAVQQAFELNKVNPSAVKSPEELIRFHVVANSDSEEDQALKRAVRDAILKEVSPRLAASHSLEESRKILTGLRPEMEKIGQQVVEFWGKDYSVKSDYGKFIFPTKSYGSLVLPSGEYEAVRVLIGEAKGSNWWCVLFPPLCFVDIEHSTAVAVDGKPGIPYDEKNSISEVKNKGLDKDSNGGADSPVQGNYKESKRLIEKPKVRFWIVEELSRIFRAF